MTAVKKKKYIHTSLQDVDKLTEQINKLFNSMTQFSLNMKEYLHEVMEKKLLKEKRKKTI